MPSVSFPLVYPGFKLSYALYSTLLSVSAGAVMRMHFKFHHIRLYECILLNCFLSIVSTTFRKKREVK